MRRRVLFTVLLGIFLISGMAWADFYVIPTTPKFVGTKITSLPYTITQPGFYYLEKNLDTTGDGVVLQANDVTIDLAGFVIKGPTPNSNYGIKIGSHSNVEVRNGTVRNFKTGITTDGMGNRIINMRLVANGHFGVISNGTALLLMKCTAIVNAIGFDINNSANILENQAFHNFSTGFNLYNNPTTLVDKNVSAGNSLSNWLGLTGCTKGLNTPLGPSDN